MGLPVAVVTSLTVTSPQADWLAAAGGPDAGAPADPEVRGALAGWAGAAVVPPELEQAARPVHSSAAAPMASADRGKMEAADGKVIMECSYGGLLCGDVR
jgi:hypothetical protein